MLAVVVGEVRARGDCRLPIDAIAAMAGVGRTTAKNAIRIAADIGLVHVTLRPMKGAKNRTNIIAIVDRAVIAWIKRGPRRPRPGESGQKIDPHVYKDSQKGLPAGGIETQRSYPHSRTCRRR